MIIQELISYLNRIDEQLGYSSNKTVNVQLQGVAGTLPFDNVSWSYESDSDSVTLHVKAPLYNS